MLAPKVEAGIEPFKPAESLAHDAKCSLMIEILHAPAHTTTRIPRVFMHRQARSTLVINSSFTTFGQRLPGAVRTGGARITRGASTAFAHNSSINDIYVLGGFQESGAQKMIPIHQDPC